MDLSDWIAVAALVLSVATALFTWYRTARWDRPVIAVTGRNWIAYDPHNDTFRDAAFGINVVNTGNHATQVTYAGWELDTGTYLFATPGNESGGRMSGLVPERPFTLDRNQTKEWTLKVPITLMPDRDRAQRVRAVVDYVARGKNTTVVGVWEPLKYRVEARDGT